MGVTTISDQALQELITGKSKVDFEFLAARILLTTLRARARTDSSPAAIAHGVAELKDLLARFEKLPAVQGDLQKITVTGHSSTGDQALFGVDEVKAKIAQGRSLVLAGDRALLRQLPAGKWIGGTIPYFMATQGGVFTKDKIFVTEMPDAATSVSIRAYSDAALSSVYKDAPENGLSIVIIPGSSPAHFSFALNAPRYERFAMRPLIGWIAGTDVADIGKVAPEVFTGDRGMGQKDGAAVMHIGLPSDRQASINIVNIFRQGSGDSISFPQDGFRATDALVNGARRNFAEYLAEKKVDTKLPLVADYNGAMINTSFQEVGASSVSFYAPVFHGVEYKVARPVADYVSAFETQLPRAVSGTIAFSCNCILNYLYSNLEGKKTGNVTGPITFGEIAYQLLNQTLAYVTIQKTKS